MGLTALMQLIFLLGGAARGPVYIILNGVALVASLIAAGGFAFSHRRDGPMAISVGFAVNAIVRVAMVLTMLSRLPVWLNLFLTVGYFWVAVAAGLWAARPAEAVARVKQVRVGCYLLGAAYFLSLGRALGGGSIPAMLALTIGSLGFLFLAPLVAADPDAASSQPAKKAQA